MNSFEQRINKISKIIQTETDGEYALQPLANSCVSGKTERHVYDGVNTLVKFSILKLIVDIESTLNNC